MNFLRPLVIVVFMALTVAVACGNSDEPEAADSTTPAASAPGIRVVDAAEAASVQGNPPADLVVLDVRTPEEFAEGHLEDAIMIDFYEADFADQLADLDRDAPYLLYCRSGNRSGQTRAIMEDLGFTDVTDVDGGVISWLEAGFPLVTS